MKPSTAIRLAARRALRKRYGYAGLRSLRQAVARALELRALRSVSPAPYVAEPYQKIRAAYAAALRRLFKRWPDLDVADPRSLP